ncbi:MAG: helix-turn-helix transcriptional regulator [Sulfuritalea sp.]|nr:helix-turn-helix transcriptional regulator [Sulfuritalea sp.]
MKNFSLRLKEERERITLTQAAFAKLCGVGKTAQYTYESGQRFPDAGYLAAAEGLGVDLSYLFSGMREDEKVDYDLARWELFDGMFAALGFSPDDVEKFSRSIIPLLHDAWSGDGESREEWRSAKLLPAVLEILKASPFIKGLADKPWVNVELLESVLRAIDESDAARSLPAIKRARVAALAYRLAGDGGKVSQDVIEQAALLAAV